MLRKALLAVLLVVLVGCSYLSIEALPGDMSRLDNHRYGYHVLIPKTWKRAINSQVRPTELVVRPQEEDAAIIIRVMEGREAPGTGEFVKRLSAQAGVEHFTLIDKGPAYFPDMTGHIAKFRWVGTMSFGGKEYGEPGVEYQATTTMVSRDPSPILLVCLARKEKFRELNLKYFAHSHDALTAKPVELTVREIPEQ